MDTRPAPFVPPAHIPRTKPPGRFEIIRTVLRNPLELWGEPSYNKPWIMTKFLNERSLIVNHPGLIRHVLVDNVANYKMAVIRQLVLRPILRDGLLTAEGETWRRSRKAMAPVFTPRHARSFAEQMLEQSNNFAKKYGSPSPDGNVFDISRDMTDLTFRILSTTLFSGEIGASEDDFADDVDRLLSTMGRIDPLDLIKAPKWLPRLRRIPGLRVLAKFRKLVRDTMASRLKRMADDPENVPRDFLTLLLKQMGPDGLSEEEVEDNLVTFIGAGHETTARALAWTLYCLSNSPADRAEVEAEIDRVVPSTPDPVKWLEKMPWTRAVFEETMRLYPPAPSINRMAIEDDSYTAPDGNKVEIPAGTTILVMPWTLHRHTQLWDQPRAFIPSRFLPANRDQIDRYQYLPFGVGPRICIGATFALQEAVIALAVLLRNYRFDSLADTNPWPVQKLTTQPGGGLKMRVSSR